METCQEISQREIKKKLQKQILMCVIFCRLSKYSQLLSTCKLQEELGEVETRLQQAKAQGSDKSVGQQLTNLSSVYTTSGMLTPNA